MSWTSTSTGSSTLIAASGKTSRSCSPISAASGGRSSRSASFGFLENSPTGGTIHWASMAQPMRIIPLGGLGEVGKNMTVIEGGGGRLVIDAGLAFPRDEHL